MSHRVKSRYIVSHRALLITCRIVSHRVRCHVSHRVRCHVSHRVRCHVSHHVASCHIVSDVTSCQMSHVTSCQMSRVTSCHIMSHHVTALSVVPPLIKNAASSHKYRRSKCVDFDQKNKLTTAYTQPTCIFYYCFNTF